MTNHKSKAQEVLREKCMCEFNAASSGVNYICLVCDVAKALAEAEIEGARKMREKAKKESETVYFSRICQSHGHADGEIKWNFHGCKEISEAISQLSPESVVEGGHE